MKLSQQDADLFYRLMLNLQFFVNCEKKVDPEITNFTEYKETSMEEKSTVRSVLYEHPVMEVVLHAFLELFKRQLGLVGFGFVDPDFCSKADC
jgi:hypothetical protein